MIPFDVIYIIISFLPWKYRSVMVCRKWLRAALKRRTKLSWWVPNKLLYSYMSVFGTRFSNRSWSTMATFFRIKRRVRNSQFRLTWQAAVRRHMTLSCQSCGRESRASVFGVVICQRCRQNVRLKYCYMISTTRAKRLGVPKRILDETRSHLVNRKRLRFWRELPIQTEIQKSY